LYYIIGGDSTIGSALKEFFCKNNIQFKSTTRRKILNKKGNNLFLDLAEKSSIKNFKLDCDSVIICAGITNISFCNQNPEYSRNVNVNGIKALIDKIVKNDAHFIYLSTNQVFNGQKPFTTYDEKRSPITSYGKQKLMAENYTEKMPNHCILRLTKVIHPSLSLFKVWHKQLSNKDKVFAFKDMTICPVTINQVIRKINLILSKKLTGVFQLSNSEEFSYFDLAKRFALEHGYDPKLVIGDTYKNKLEYDPPNFTSLKNI
jgi:dTDP-4-dehydrorhamnose reductase